MLKESHQVFDGVRPVVPLWRAKLVPAFHDQSQHQQLFAMPEWGRTSKKREHDHTTSPPVETRGENAVQSLCDHKKGLLRFNSKTYLLTGQPLSHIPHVSHPWSTSESLVPDTLVFHTTLTKEIDKDQCKNIVCCSAAKKSEILL